MQWSWPKNSGYLEHIWIWSSNEIMETEESANLIRHKILPIGHAPNGDFLVLDFSSEPYVPGFVSVYQYWREGGKDDPRSSFEPLARTFESLLFRFVEKRYVPYDYPDTREFNEFLAEERQNSPP